MKIITQVEPEPWELTLNDIEDDDHYVIDRDVYSPFLDLDKQNYAIYIRARNLEISLKDDTSLDDSFFNSIELEKKYRKDYDNQRQKFYVYNAQVYSYTYMGMMNVGHVIEILRYEQKDVEALLNKLMSMSMKKSFLEKAWRGIISIFN